MIVSIDGNIGSGKSTILDILSQRGFKVVKEGTDIWSDVLQNFYQEQSRWSFTLQTAILIDMHEKYKALSHSNDIIFFERNPVSSLLFTENSYENKYLNNTEYSHYMRLYKLLSWKPDRIIKLNTPPDVCYSRIMSRNDPGTQSGLTLQYVEKLNDKYNFMEGEYIDGTCSVDEIADTILDLVGH